jgi:mono/diheme cytochrome c family protein
MKSHCLFATLCGIAALALTPAVQAESPSAAASPQAAEFFEKQVRPILADHCFSCHGDKKQKGGLRLDSRTALLKGGDDGPVVTPGNPEKSILIRAIRHDGDLKMPPKGKLTDAAIDALTQWVKMGAPWPEASAAAASAAAADPIAEARRTHWAFQPIRQPPLPAVENTAWVQNLIDRFVLARLEAQGMQPSPPADRRTLIRRATFDLLGLPPTPEEVAAFEADPAPDAFARVVDRLLASPAYGERWARHWLDVARYADTKGYVFTEERRFPYAYTYRDYVIRAFNEDLPYDQFIVQQLAADRLPLGRDNRPLAAMGFLTLGRRFLNNINDIIDDRIDVVSRGLLGLTVTCARCHDHKFDPIPTADYYSLYGVFASSVEPTQLPTIATTESSEATRAFEKQLQTLQAEVDRFKEAHQTELKSRNRKFRDELRKLQKKVDQLRVTHPGSPAQAMVLNDAPQPVQPHILKRGNPNNRGPAVPRRFLAVLSGPERKPFTEGSGRLELARAIASKENPLTARVMVNRIWLHHFGAGLVRTPSNFGLRGEPPTRPDLLDYLAASFMDNGWSIKKIHRLILLSSTYQQSSADRRDYRERDPDNRLLWKMNRQRLEFEPLRDAVLAVAGRLDRTMGGRAVEIIAPPFQPRRSVYGFIDRQNLPGVLRTFDFASPDSSTAQRYATTVPQQALYLMNSPFLVEQARHLMQRPDLAGLARPEQRIDRLYRLLYGRAADPAEVSLGMQFIRAAEERCQSKGSAGNTLSPWEQYAQVLLLANEFAFVD